MANLFDRPMVDVPEEMDPGMKDSVDSRKAPRVDHSDTQWIPAFAGMTKKDQSPRSHGFSPFSRRRESIKMHPKSVFLRYFGLFFVLFWFGSLQGNKAYFTKNLQI